MADNDVQLDLKKRARRRLVGAVALALLAAIILPMVMESEPKRDTEELQIRIPSQEGSNFASRLIKNSAPAPRGADMPAQSSSAAAAASRPVQDVPREAIQTASTPEAVTVERNASASSAPIAAAQASSADHASNAKSSARAQASREAHSKSTPAAADPKTYVQLGVFRDETNAQEIQARAKAVGVKASIQKMGKITRVRSGPYADRAAADAMVIKLKKAGLSAIVTNK